MPRLHTAGAGLADPLAGEAEGEHRLATSRAPFQNFQMRFSCTPSKEGVPVAFSKSTQRMV